MSMHYNSRGSENDFTTLLEGATKEVLQDLIENEDKINELICDHEKIKKIKLDKELLLAENRSIADHNISKEPRLIQLRETLAAKYEHLKELNEAYLVNQAKLASLQKDVNLETMLAVLQATSAQTEEEADELAEKLYTGDLGVGDFITEFKAKRTLMHMREIKAAKMKDLILDAERSLSPSSPAPIIPPRIPVAANRAAPYPGSSQQAPAYPSYPAKAFSQPSAQQYPGYKWN